MNKTDKFSKKDISIWYRLILSLPAVLIALTIFLLSHTPHPEFPKIGIVWEDKIAHLIAYFVFGISLILFIITNHKNIHFKSIVIVTLSFGAFYGLSDEFHQYFIPGRDVEFLDWVADTVGISLSLLFINILKKNIIRRDAGI
jgi:VanZ family protein